MISEELMRKVLSQAQKSAIHSWEYGTVFEAFLEYYSPSLCIFNSPFPGGEIPTLNKRDVPALQYVKPFIKLEGNRLCEGNGSSSDPCSLGIPALLFSKYECAYLDAVTRQLDSLLANTPRFPNGAISHRDAYASLWADFIYMVPPFLAYYAVSSKDIAYAKESVQQCGLYYEILKHESECWKHIIDAPGTSSQSIKQDPGLWSTSNGWAAAGMSRVLATLRKSSFATETWEEQDSLVQMTKGIIDGAMSLDTDPSGLLRNRLNDESWFGECAGTTLLAATVFRMAVLEPGVFEEKYTDWAQAKMRVAIRCIDAETGVIAPVVNPTRDEQRLPLEGVSPEAQAFVGLMMAGWRDWESTVIGDRGDAVG